MARGVIVLAMPHDMISGGAGALALWMRAGIAGYDFCMDEPVGRSNATSHDGLEQSATPAVLAIVVCGSLGGKVVHGGLAIDFGSDSYHVLTVALWLGATIWDRLVDPVCQVSEASVAGNLADACGEMGGMRRV